MTDYLFAEGLVNINAFAFANVSETNRVLINFLLDSEPRQVPGKTFYDQEKAIVWLQQHV